MIRRLKEDLIRTRSSHKVTQQSRGFLPRFEEWLLSGESRADDDEVLLSAFLASGGSLLTEASNLASRHWGHVEFPTQLSRFGLASKESSYLRALQELRQDGFTVLPFTLSSDEVAGLYEYLRMCPGKFIGDEIQEATREINRLRPENFERPLAEKFQVDTAALLSFGPIMDLAMDPGLLSLAQDYLGTVPRLDICTSWFSFPVGRSSNEAATQFHFDLDRSKWIKIFIFLTDVSAETGAHVFIPTTQQDGQLPRHILRKGYTRLDDSTVEQFFPQEKWACIEGIPGTILIEDTRGLHKGLPLLRDHRLLLQFQYSQNLFGSPSHLAQTSRSEITYTGSITEAVANSVLSALGA